MVTAPYPFDQHSLNKLERHRMLLFILRVESIVCAAEWMPLVAVPIGRRNEVNEWNKTAFWKHVVCGERMFRKITPRESSKTREFVRCVFMFGVCVCLLVAQKLQFDRCCAGVKLSKTTTSYSNSNRIEWLLWLRLYTTETCWRRAVVIDTTLNCYINRMQYFGIYLSKCD